MSETANKQRLGGHTQLFGQQLATLKDLQDFKNELLTEVKKTVKENAGQPAKKWLKTKEVMALLDLSEVTLNGLRAN